MMQTVAAPVVVAPVVVIDTPIPAALAAAAAIHSFRYTPVPVDTPIPAALAAAAAAPAQATPPQPIRRMVPHAPNGKLPKASQPAPVPYAD